MPESRRKNTIGKNLAVTEHGSIAGWLSRVSKERRYDPDEVQECRE